jgi:hypothetical protein
MERLFPGGLPFTTSILTRRGIAASKKIETRNGVRKGDREMRRDGRRAVVF